MKTAFIQHNNNGKLYRIVGQCRLQQGNVWQTGVAYVQCDARHDDPDAVFVRTEQELLDSFTGITWIQWREIGGANQTAPWPAYGLPAYDGVPLAEPA